MPLDPEQLLQDLERAGGKAEAVYLYIVARALQRKGVFELNNSYLDPETGRTHLVYKHLESGKIYRCERPELNEEQERHVEAEVETIVKGETV